MNFPLFNNWPRILNPKIEFPITQYNIDDLQIRENMALRKIEYILQKHNAEISCIILEPIQGEGGDNHFRASFWNELRSLANKYNVLLIADEIQSGVGLTGKMWAYEHYGGVPDILVFGKKMQVCGFMCTDRINKFGIGLDSNRINSTWGGNLVDMVRSNKFLEIIDNDKLVDNAHVVGTYILQLLGELQKEYPNLCYNIRGKGLMIAFDLPNCLIRDKVIELAFKKQMLLLPCGNNSIRLRPFLDFDLKHAELFIKILNECLYEIKK
jgi:L-lysine 6-transaminase